MKTFVVCKAAATGDRFSESVSIQIGNLILVDRYDNLGRDNAPYTEHDAAFMAEAETIEKALHDALPGGTYDRLAGLMLKRKSSHFIVSHAS